MCFEEKKGEKKNTKPIRNLANHGGKHFPIRAEFDRLRQDRLGHLVLLLHALRSHKSHSFLRAQASRPLKDVLFFLLPPFLPSIYIYITILFLSLTVDFWMLLTAPRLEP